MLANCFMFAISVFILHLLSSNMAAGTKGDKSHIDPSGEVLIETANRVNQNLSWAVAKSHIREDECFKNTSLGCVVTVATSSDWSLLDTLGWVQLGLERGLFLSRFAAIHKVLQR